MLAAFYATWIRSGSIFSIMMQIRIWIRIQPNDADPTGSGSTTLLNTAGTKGIKKEDPIRIEQTR